MIRRLFPCFIPLLAAAACSSTGATDTSGIDAVEACPSFVAAQRERALRCGTNAGAEGSPANEARAVERLSLLCKNAMSAPGNGIAPKALDTCSAALRTGPCDDLGVCETVLATPGTLADGSPCGLDSQCAGGLCMKTTNDGSVGCGTCAQRAPVGGACGSGQPPCVSGAICRRDGAGGSSCVMLAKLALGEVCFEPGARAVNGICSDGVCEIGDGSAVTKCTARRVAGPLLEEGATCKHSLECASRACAVATKKCTRPTYGAAGAPCNSTEKLCARGTCAKTNPSTNDGTCVDPIAEGGACGSGHDGTSATCDIYARCVDRKCQLFDPATCK